MSVVNNSADTRSLAGEVTAVTEGEQCALFSRLWGEERCGDHRVGVFCSRLIPSKEVEFLMDAAVLVHERLPQFRLLMIGDGPLRETVASFAAEHPWCAFCGPVHGGARAPFLALADVWLNPGTTGLAILDAFAAGVPYITTQRTDHGPEIAYLATGNGRIVPDDADALAAAVLELIRDSQELSRLKEGARGAAQQYTIEAMADRFSEGITNCLGSVDRKGSSG